MNRVCLGKGFPKNLLRMFMHAHHTSIFNKILSARIKENMPLKQAIVGDVVCFRDDDGLPDASRTQIVTQADIDGINSLIRKNATVLRVLAGN